MEKDYQANRQWSNYTLGTIAERNAIHPRVPHTQPGSCDCWSCALENKIKEYVEAGGRKPPEDEMKSDLNAILPAELGDHLTVRVSDPQQSYAIFRDFVVYTCAQLLMRRKKLPVNALGGPTEQGGNEDDQAAGSVEQLDEWYLNALSDIHAGRGGNVDQLDEWYIGALGNIRSKGLRNRGKKGAGKGGKGGKGSGKNGGQS